MDDIVVRVTDQHVKCPECGKQMLVMLGEGWDFDRFVCGIYMCDGEIELETTTYAQEYIDKTKELCSS
jgi:hypothetical protein